jgi:hypothetical protein
VSNVPGNGGVDEGFIAGFVIFDFESLDQLIPANTRTEAFRLDFNVKPDAPVGTTEVRFVDGARRSGPTAPIGNPVHNTLISGGQPVSPDARAGFVFINALVSILPGGTPFVRGDSNGDQKIDISDPKFTLSHLFLGTVDLKCPDAADANDDGRVDVSPWRRSCTSSWEARPFPRPGKRPARIQRRIA